MTSNFSASEMRRARMGDNEMASSSQLCIISEVTNGYKATICGDAAHPEEEEEVIGVTFDDVCTAVRTVLTCRKAEAMRDKPTVNTGGDSVSEAGEFIPQTIINTPLPEPRY